MTKFKSGEYERPKPKPKTVLVVCAGCLTKYYDTIVGFPHQYVEIIRTRKCRKCGEVKLATSDLAKARPRTNAQAFQLSLGLDETPSKNPRR
ncbi:MAG TPA: hypothetical protein VF077_09800 [Nitrospiraceae bacterium]